MSTLAQPRTAAWGMGAAEAAAEIRAGRLCSVEAGEAHLERIGEVNPSLHALVWLDEAKHWREVRAKLERWVTKLAANIRRGNFPLAPRSEHCTDTCPFGQVCRITQARAVAKDGMLPLPGQE